MGTKTLVTDQLLGPWDERCGWMAGLQTRLAGTGLVQMTKGELRERAPGQTAPLPGPRRAQNFLVEMQTVGGGRIKFWQSWTAPFGANCGGR